uniref:Mu-conotoxin-like SxIIIB n=1 Tax=Conus striolatus TaxID=101315 RepID=CM3B_CONSR|nr:RecName: Full=Mu-conotoxin-like SxIIIB [Conus striolatus]
QKCCTGKKGSCSGRACKNLRCCA